MGCKTGKEKGKVRKEGVKGKGKEKKIKEKGEIILVLIFLT
jgi:hypothetical protein